MRKQTIYIDTSVIGGCFDDEFKYWSDKLILDFKNGTYIPVLSEITAGEINDAPLEVRKKYQEIKEYSSIYLEINNPALELAGQYQKRNALTKKFFTDGLHIAVATLYNNDVLVSWNFKHIVHFYKIRLFNAINLEMGYKPIEIFSPGEVATNEDD